MKRREETGYERTQNKRNEKRKLNLRATKPSVFMYINLNLSTSMLFTIGYSCALYVSSYMQLGPSKQPISYVI